MAGEMVERVARALLTHHPAFDSANMDDAKSGGWPIWFQATEQARAAIEAMREPTKEMVRWANDECGSFTGMVEYDERECRDIYRAAVERALREP
jgi:hypothetical protein